ncbi:MAG: hypothetical protein KH281_05445 [Lachnospiraceae bacterium]|nr:hypothetical protein [Lachnospiraceae bacterium]
MRKDLIKFSDERNRRNSIRTIILRDETTGEKHVVKEAIYPEGKAHLMDMLEYKKALDSMFPEIRTCPVEEKDGALWFEFIKGDSLEDRYRACAKEQDKVGFMRLLDYQASLIEGKEENRCTFHSTPEFEKIFGVCDEFEGSEGLKVSNFDAIPGNIIFQDEEPCFIDYEWVFLFPMPKELVLFHCIRDLYFHLPSLEKFYPLDEAMKYLRLHFPMERLDEAYGKFHHYVICENDGASFAGAKAGALKERRDVQYYMNDALYARKEWEKCAKNWQDAVRANEEMETYWQQASQANYQLNARLVKAEDTLKKKEQEFSTETRRLTEERDIWKQAYETVVNSKTWKAAQKLKRTLGKKV